MFTLLSSTASGFCITIYLLLVERVFFFFTCSLIIRNLPQYLRDLCFENQKIINYALFDLSILFACTNALLQTGLLIIIEIVPTQNVVIRHACSKQIVL